MKNDANTDSLIQHLESLKRRISELETSERQFRATLYGIGDGMIATDADGCVRQMNPVAEALTGWNEADACGRFIDEVFCILNEHSRRTVESPVTRALREGTVVGLANHTLLIARDGNERPIADSGAPIYDENGAVTGVVLVFRDQTREREAREREAHLKKVLLAIRNVNQLIVAEPDPAELIKKACANLTETLGYHNAWIALLDETANTVIMTGNSGFNGGFRAMRRNLECGIFPPCMKQTLAQDEPVVLETPSAACPDCPLSCQYADRARLTRALRFDERLYGTLSVSVPARFAHDTEAQSLFNELAGDLAFALHKIETDVQRHRLEHIVSTLPQPMAFVSHDYRYLAVNEVYAELYNIPRDQIQGQTVADFCSDDIFEQSIKPNLDRCLSGEKISYQVEVDFREKGNRWMEMLYCPYCNTEGVITGVVSHGVDITERKRADQTLRESEERFRQIYEHMPVGVAQVSLDFKIAGANEAYCRMLGYHEAELIGKHLKDFTHPETVEENLRKQARLAAGEIDHYRMEKQFVHKDGHVIHGILDANLVREADGSPLYFLGSVLDISDLKRAEEEKARLERKFQQSQKLESIGRLAGGVAHDLNNMLSPILGYGEMLLDDTSRFDPRKTAMEAIVHAGIRARDLVRQLLAFGRQQMLDFKPVDVNELLQNFEDLIRRTLREDITIHMKRAPSLPLIEGDAGQLEQVIMNLVVNAQDAMPEGGRLTIETAAVELDELYAERYEGVIPGSYVLMSMTDTGHGMDRNTRENLFEPFFTTKEKDRGTGLGLATVYGIIKQHKGNIWIYSEPGMGATFKIYLPVSEKSAHSRQQSAKETPELCGSETILLVEDNRQVRKLAYIILQRQGYHIICAENGPEALSLLENCQKPPHLLLTDVIMPEMNGRQLFEKTAALYPDIKVVYMSGYADNILARHGIIDNGLNFIEKPFTVKALADTIRKTLDH